MHLLKTFTRLFYLLVTLMLASCNVAVVLNDTTSGTLPQDTDLIKTYNLPQASSSGSELICDYGSQDYKSDRNVSKVIVYGLGERPVQVDVSRDSTGKEADVTAALPSITAGPTPDVATGGGWTALGNGLNCSIFGCAGGRYSVKVSYAADFSSCPTQLKLEVQVPPS